MNGKTLLAEAIEMKDEIVENRRAIHRAPEVGAHPAADGSICRRKAAIARL